MNFSIFERIFMFQISLKNRNNFLNILVLGGGGREHAICWAVKKPENVVLFCIPGNQELCGL